MTDQPNPVPKRIGDAERDRAAELLRDHLAEGRLDQMEFDERVTKALEAKTAEDLTPLFDDLPGPKPIEPAAPSQQVVPRPATVPPARVSAVRNMTAALAAVAWPAALVICFATNWHYWWIILIPIFFPWWIGQPRQPPRRYYR